MIVDGEIEIDGERLVGVVHFGCLVFGVLSSGSGFGDSGVTLHIRSV